MAKKRKASSRNTGADENGFDPKGGKMGPISTYEDIADSEEEFLMQRDKVMLDDGPEAKRRRKYEEEDALLQPSDEEVLGYSSESSEDEEETPRKHSKGIESDDGEREGEEDEEEEGWGTSKKDYYNADEIQTEADALEEEAEAKRIQQKKFQKMTEADFGFDESEWLDAKKADEDGDGDGDVVTEVLKDIEITPEMGPEERLRILKTRYPEFEFLANELVALQPVLKGLQQQMEEENPANVTVVKSRALAAYITSLTMYFALLTSPAFSTTETQTTLNPTELRDHPVMDSLLSCRTLWSKVKSLQEPILTPLTPFDTHSNSDSSPEELPTTLEEQPEPTKSKKALRKSAAESTLAAQQASRLEAANASLRDLDSLLPSKSKSRSSKSAKSKPPADSNDNSDSDFGEETHLTTAEALKKANRKKTLKFYTSQITQKANKRVGAGRDAGGDEDLPYRERLKDRQTRLNAEAEKRGKKLDEFGRGGRTSGQNVELGGDDDDDEAGNTNVSKEEQNDDDDEYYNLISRTSSAKKASKLALLEATKTATLASALDRVPSDEDAEGKRAIGYTIQKNKGLAPKRKKDVRNPRVKKRKKFEEKKKKLGSMKAIYKGGEERGGYGGGEDGD
ncbi:hypothetical protein G7Y89_g13545 [Cudoniella acicularis]|uniref:Sas10 C-terminal domain-containing protein n=1 Tax=Cudoniella acicularis TaxID=354080 RepID=A0A8H4VWB8_9HELO|nr:hypothetical protein G7Y89_g13545 [Cudoniella acicularis]